MYSSFPTILFRGSWSLSNSTLFMSHSMPLLFAVSHCMWMRSSYFLLIFHLPTGCHWNMNVCGHHPIDITRRSLGISYEVKTWWQEMIGWVCVCACLCVGFAWHLRDLNPIYTLLNTWQDACEFLCVCLCVSRTPPVTGECHVWWSLLPYTCSAPAINFADANEPYCITEA